jgi:hypothetical protein
VAVWPLLAAYMRAVQPQPPCRIVAAVSQSRLRFSRTEKPLQSATAVDERFASDYTPRPLRRQLRQSNELCDRAGVASDSGAHERRLVIPLPTSAKAGTITVFVHDSSARGRPCLVLRVGIRAKTHELGDRARVAAFRCVQKRSAATFLRTQSHRASHTSPNGECRCSVQDGGPHCRAGHRGTRAATNPHVRPGRDEAADFGCFAHPRRFQQLRHRTCTRQEVVADSPMRASCGARPGHLLVPRWSRFRHGCGCFVRAMVSCARWVHVPFCCGQQVRRCEAMHMIRTQSFTPPFGVSACPAVDASAAVSSPEIYRHPHRSCVAMWGVPSAPSPQLVAAAAARDGPFVVDLSERLPATRRL